jgi:hypothetical protein
MRRSRLDGRAAEPPFRDIAFRYAIRSASVLDFDHASIREAPFPEHGTKTNGVMMSRRARGPSGAAHRD